MKYFFLFLLICLNVSFFQAQNKSLQLSVNRLSRWHFINLSYRYEFKNKIELHLGMGYNITHLFNEGNYSNKLFISPYEQKFINNLALDYGIKKYFQLESLTTKLYLNYVHNLTKPTFIYRSYYEIANNN
jgi:hypothetical protein